MATEQEIEDWFNSGPIKRDTLNVWLGILNKGDKDE